MSSAPWLAVYQPLIVGLGAVVLGLLANSALEWIKQTLTDRRRARAIRRVVLHELLHFQRAAEGALEKEHDPPSADQSFLVPVSTEFPIYDHHSKDLGLLELEEIGPVVEAYSYVKALPEWLIVIGRLHRTEHILTAVVPSANAEALFGINRKVLSKLKHATRLLQTRVPTAA